MQRGAGLAWGSFSVAGPARGAWARRLGENPKTIDVEFLERHEEFREVRARSTPKVSKGGVGVLLGDVYHGYAFSFERWGLRAFSSRIMASIISSLLRLSLARMRTARLRPSKPTVRLLFSSPYTLF